MVEIFSPFPRQVGDVIRHVPKEILVVKKKKKNKLSNLKSIGRIILGNDKIVGHGFRFLSKIMLVFVKLKDEIASI